MTDARDKIVQYLDEARSSELGLVRELQAQIAMTPRGAYRTLLEKHLVRDRGWVELTAYPLFSPQSLIAEGTAKADVAVTPLAMPMLAGPGAISTIMVLASQAQTISQSIVVYLSIVVTAVVCWLTLRIGETLLARMGQTGIRVMTRIMGLLLAAIAAQFVLTGVREGLGL